MARKAAEAGFDGAAELFGMTPVEAELALTAFAARQRQALERLDEAAIRELVSRMVDQQVTPTCPHGRPLVVALSHTELDKRFRRIQ